MIIQLSYDQIVNLSSPLIAFAGLIFVGYQIRQSRRENKMAALYQIYGVNRELISLGFSHPKLFAIMDDSKDADPVWERRYLQLWLNQLWLIYSSVKHSAFDTGFKKSLESDMREFISQQNSRRYWAQNGVFFDPSFQKFVNNIINANSNPQHPPTSEHGQAPKT